MSGLTIKRISVSLDQQDYDRLKTLSKKCKPRLSLQYIANYAIQELLKEADNPQLMLRMGNPVEINKRS